MRRDVGQETGEENEIYIYICPLLLCPCCRRFCYNGQHFHTPGSSGAGSSQMFIFAVMFGFGFQRSLLSYSFGAGKQRYPERGENPAAGPERCGAVRERARRVLRRAAATAFKYSRECALLFLSPPSLFYVKLRKIPGTILDLDPSARCLRMFRSGESIKGSLWLLYTSTEYNTTEHNNLEYNLVPRVRSAVCSITAVELIHTSHIPREQVCLCFFPYPRPHAPATWCIPYGLVRCYDDKLPRVGF